MKPFIELERCNGAVCEKIKVPVIDLSGYSEEKESSVMDLLDFLPAWLTATPVNFVLAALVILYLLSVLLERVRVDIDKKTEVGIICGVESACRRLAATLHRAERFELANSAEEILEQAVRRNMVILFIVRNELSGIAEDVFAHLQNAYRDNENKNRYSGLRYAVFGIGDTLSEDFNALAVEFDLRLRMVGAQSVVPMRLFDVITTTDGLENEFFDFIMAFSPSSVSGPNSTGVLEVSDDDTSDSELSVTEEDVVSRLPDAFSDSESEVENAVTENKEQIDDSDESAAVIEDRVDEIKEANVETKVPNVEDSSPVTQKPKVEIVEPSVDISTSVFEAVEPELDSEEAEPDNKLDGSEVSGDEPEVAGRPRSPKQDKSETEDDEGWEIIKVMSNKDDSS